MTTRARSRGAAKHTARVSVFGGAWFGPVVTAFLALLDGKPFSWVVALISGAVWGIGQVVLVVVTLRSGGRFADAYRLRHAESTGVLPAGIRGEAAQALAEGLRSDDSMGRLVPLACLVGSIPIVVLASRAESDAWSLWLYVGLLLAVAAAAPAFFRRRGRVAARLLRELEVAAPAVEHP